jgi:hypothetical protein
LIGEGRAGHGTLYICQLLQSLGRRFATFTELIIGVIDTHKQYTLQMKQPKQTTKPIVKKKNKSKKLRNRRQAESSGDDDNNHDDVKQHARTLSAATTTTATGFVVSAAASSSNRLNESAASQYTNNGNCSVSSHLPSRQMLLQQQQQLYRAQHESKMQAPPMSQQQMQQQQQPYVQMQQQQQYAQAQQQQVQLRQQQQQQQQQQQRPTSALSHVSSPQSQSDFESAGRTISKQQLGGVAAGYTTDTDATTTGGAGHEDTASIAGIPLRDVDKLMQYLGGDNCSLFSECKMFKVFEDDMKRVIKEAGGSVGDCIAYLEGVEVTRR